MSIGTEVMSSLPFLILEICIFFFLAFLEAYQFYIFFSKNQFFVLIFSINFVFNFIGFSSKCNLFSSYFESVFCFFVCCQFLQVKSQIISLKSFSFSNICIFSTINLPLSTAFAVSQNHQNHHCVQQCLQAWNFPFVSDKLNPFSQSCRTTPPYGLSFLQSRMSVPLHIR